LPAGRGKVFQKQLEDVLTTLRDRLTRAFASDEYQRQRKALTDGYSQVQQKLLEELQAKLHDQGLTVEVSPAGVLLIPLKDNRPMKPEEFQALPADEQKAFAVKQTELQPLVAETVAKARDIERESSKKVSDLDRGVAEYQVDSLFGTLL